MEPGTGQGITGDNATETFALILAASVLFTTMLCYIIHQHPQWYLPTSPSTTGNLCFSKLLPPAHEYLHICTPWIGRARVPSLFWHSGAVFPLSNVWDSQWLLCAIWNRVHTESVNWKTEAPQFVPRGCFDIHCSTCGRSTVISILSSPSQPPNCICLTSRPSLGWKNPRWNQYQRNTPTPIPNPPNCIWVTSCPFLVGGV